MQKIIRHKSGDIETYYIDALGRKQGPYSMLYNTGMELICMYVNDRPNGKLICRRGKKILTVEEHYKRQPLYQISYNSDHGSYTYLADKLSSSL